MKSTLSILIIGVFILAFLFISAQYADAQSNTLTFATFGDYGANNEGEAAVASMVNSWSPDLILALGDDYIPGAGGVDSEKYDLSTGKYFCNFLKDISTTGTACPVGQASINRFFPALGDHDYTDAGMSPDNMPSTYLNYFTLPGEGYTNSSNNERYYDFVSGSVHFFIVNSLDEPGFEPDGTNSTSVQAQWLRTQLGASTSTWNVVVVHNPPFSSGIRHGSTAHMQWPYAEWGADVVFSGDEHNYERILRDGIVYFVNGLGGAWIYPLGTPIEGSAARYDASHGAQRVIVTNDSMTFEFYSIENGGTLRDTYTITVPHNTATPSLPPVSNGWQSPAGQASVKSNAGDNDGYEVNPTFAFAPDGLAAMDIDSGTSPSFTCADSGMEKHRFFNYNLSIPSGATVQGIQVRLDADADSAVGNPKICVSLSGNNGTSWTAWKSSPVLTDTEESYFLGGTSDTWGNTWAPEELSNTSFQVRVANITSDNNTDFSLDWIAVHVIYTIDPTPTPTPTESPTITPTVSQTETLTATATPSSTETMTQTATHSPTPTFTDTPEIETATETTTATATPSSTMTMSPTATLTAFNPPTHTSTSTATATRPPANPLKVIQFKSGAAQDGWVLESSETSNQGKVMDATAATFQLGDTASRQQYRTVLSFNTNALPDNAIITGVTLKIKRQGVTGTNPFTTHSKIAVDIRKGVFSTYAVLQSTDFQATASKSSVGWIANNLTATGWYSTNLTTAAYPYLNRTGITQLRLRFQTDDDNDAVADLIRFYSGNSSSTNQPVLVITYSMP